MEQNLEVHGFTGVEIIPSPRISLRRDHPELELKLEHEILMSVPATHKRPGWTSLDVNSFLSESGETSDAGDVAPVVVISSDAGFTSVVAGISGVFSEEKGSLTKR
uniref:Uncharacterized protein n=1 Tax=Romanomermis culicivorax TaxID=13658 RepID=A0A915JPN9_ROMCU